MSFTEIRQPITSPLSFRFWFLRTVTVPLSSFLFYLILLSHLLELNRRRLLNLKRSHFPNFRSVANLILNESTGIYHQPLRPLCLLLSNAWISVENCDSKKNAMQCDARFSSSRDPVLEPMIKARALEYS